MNYDILLSIGRIKAKLEQIVAQGKTDFWSNIHGWKFNPLLSEAQVQAFEHTHGISLPEGYRAFLMLVGNGGAGPYGGIQPLENWFFGPHAQYQGNNLLAKAFPLEYQTTLRWDVEDYLPGDYRDFLFGSVYVCNMQTSHQARLVVSGPSRGYIVYLNMNDRAVPYFVLDEGFLEWYERWLDQVLAGTPESWFGFDNQDYQTAKTLPTTIQFANPIPTAKDAHFEPQLERIQQKLLGAAQEGLSCFGSQQHQFGLWPAFSDDDLIGFEAHFGVALPEDYRSFLALLGNGGAGPYYGLTPLQGWFNGDFQNTDHMAHGEVLIQDFPWSYMDSLRKDKPKPEDFETFKQGSIHLGTMGCDYDIRLVVMGESRGRVVYLNSASESVYFVRDANFLDWYERWLDRLWSAKPSLWYGYDNPDYSVNLESLKV